MGDVVKKGPVLSITEKKKSYILSTDKGNHTCSWLPHTYRHTSMIHTVPFSTLQCSSDDVLKQKHNSLFLW